MKRVILFYFTGTGHTLALAKEIERKGKTEEDWEVTYWNILSSEKCPSLSGFDFGIICYPIYAFNAPKKVDEFIAKLSIPNAFPFLIAKQSGEPLCWNKASSYYIRRKIRKKRGVLRGEYHFLYPYNIHFRYEDDFVKELLVANEKLMRVMFWDLKNKHPSYPKYNVLFALNAYIFRLQRLGAFLNSYFYKVDEDKCIHCLKCVKECPVQNIRYENNKFHFSHRCLMCMRCSFMCPKNAISIGLLEKWKVNGPYSLEGIRKNEVLKGEYTKSHHKGFYSFFPKYFQEIDEMLKERKMLPEGSNQNN